METIEPTLWNKQRMEETTYYATQQFTFFS